MQNSHENVQKMYKNLLNSECRQSKNVFQSKNLLQKCQQKQGKHQRIINKHQCQSQGQVYCQSQVKVENNRYKLLLQQKKQQPENKATTITTQYQHLEHLLTCHICLSIVNFPMMCPHCSKLYCQPCIKRCLHIKSECPHCRKSIRALGMMTNCSRFINEIKAIFNDLLIQKEQEQICIEHNIQINYYCVQCQVAICCQCEMFGKHHGDNHRPIQKLSNIYNIKFNHLRDLLSEYKIELNKKKQLIKEMQIIHQNLKCVKQSQTKQAQVQFSFYKQKIIEEEKQNQMHLAKRNQGLNLIFLNVEKTQKNFKQFVKTAKKNQRYKIDFDQKEKQIEKQIYSGVQFLQNQTILYQILDLLQHQSAGQIQKFEWNYKQDFFLASQSKKQEQIQKDELNQSEKKKTVIQQCKGQKQTVRQAQIQIQRINLNKRLKQQKSSVLLQLIPQYCQSYFIIQNFSKKRQEKSIIYSPIQKMYNCQWRLKIYPNGNQSVQGMVRNNVNANGIFQNSELQEMSYMSKFMQGCNSSGSPSTQNVRNVYEYQIQLQNNRFTKKNLLREYSSSFQCGESWGYNKYIKLQNLESEGYLILSQEPSNINNNHQKANKSQNQLNLNSEDKCSAKDKINSVTKIDKTNSQNFQTILNEEKNKDKLKIIYRVRRPTYYDIYKENKLQEQNYDQILSQQDKIIKKLLDQKLAK